MILLPGPTANLPEMWREKRVQLHCRWISSESHPDRNTTGQMARAFQPESEREGWRRDPS